MYKFYAFMARLKYINRWGLMRNSRTENVSEHSHQTALIAHALGCIEKTIFKNDVDPDKCAIYAIYHEAAEALTGDLPTPIKYQNADIKNSYKAVEGNAQKRLIHSLPDELKKELGECVCPPQCIESKIVKYADKISALIKCIEERHNGEFSHAYTATKKAIEQFDSPAVDYFMKNFVDAYYLNLDELNEAD